jgi:DNA invertase Pin-like site-specific DNA recombinase
MSLIDQFIKQLDAVITTKGGKRLTTTIDFKEQIEFECINHHKFKKRYDEIVNGGWCDLCSQSNRNEKIEQILSAASIKFITDAEFLYITSDEPKMCVDYYDKVSDNSNNVFNDKGRLLTLDILTTKIKRITELKTVKYAIIIGDLDNTESTSFFTWCLNRNIASIGSSVIFTNNKYVKDFIANYKPVSIIPNSLSTLAPTIISQPQAQPQPQAQSQAQSQAQAQAQSESQQVTLRLVRPEKPKKKKEKSDINNKIIEQPQAIKVEEKFDDTREQIASKVQDEIDLRMVDIFKSTEMQASRGVKSIVGYVRVSTEEQKKYGISLSAQEDDIRRYAALSKAPIRQIYRDEGISGKNIEARPGLKECLVSLTRGEELVCSNTSRLSRNCGDTLGILNDLEKRGVKLRCLDVDGDMSKATTRLYFTLRSMLAEHERLIIAERIKSAMNYLVRGGKLKTKPPFGYKSPGKKMALVEDPEEMAIVKHIRKMTQDDPSISRSEICRRLEAAGLKCRNAKRWYIQRLTDIMRVHGITDNNGKYTTSTDNKINK